MAKERSFFYKMRRKAQVLAYEIFGKTIMSKIYFRIELGYKLRLNNPQTLNEKLQWLKLYHWPESELAIRCADKYSVRDYIKEIGKEALLNDILYAWDDVDDIPWDCLPEQFVLKCNHGCGYNILCADKSRLDIEKAKKDLRRWMNEDFSKINAEPHYQKIPRKIICEKYLGDNVINYNIFCFNGKAVFFYIAGGLGDGVGEHLTYYNLDGTRADFQNRAYPVKQTQLSPLLSEMVSTAEFLAQGFPMVRVDLFDVNGRIILSEMTFTPGGALIPWEPVEADQKLGEMLDISNLM